MDGLSEDEVAKRAFQTAPGLGRKASTLRFRIFRSYLTGESHHTYVGWADVRDVFFQSCPFSRLRSGALHVFSETALLTLAHSGASTSSGRGGPGVLIVPMSTKLITTRHRSI